MKLTEVKSLRALLSGLFVASFVLCVGAISAHAQAAAERDFSKIEVKTAKVGSNLYTLEGTGGAMSALVGPDGVLLVDASHAPMTEKVVAAVKQISNAPIRFLINTHVHPDHVGGNENFAKMGVTIIARDEVRNRLANPGNAANGTPMRPAPAGQLPMLTYSGHLTFNMDGETVEAIPIIRGHTDGDTMVYFRNADVLAIGDFFRSLGYPNIDIGMGGTVNGTIEGFAAAIALTGPNTKIIPGHGGMADKAALIAQRDMIVVIRDRVAKLLQQGKTLEEVIAAHVTSDYDAKVPQAADTSERFIGQVYTDLKAAKK